MSDQADNRRKDRRRGHHEGTYYQRPDGTWVGQIRLGWDEGKRKRVTRYGKSKEEVVAKISELRRQHFEGIVSPGERMTVERFLALWLTESLRHTVRPSTYQSYESVIRLYIVPVIGKKQLHTLSVVDVELMVAGRIAKGLSPRTAQYAHAVLRRALNQAMAWDLVTRNVAMMARAPRVEQHEATALTPEEAERFLSAARKHRLQSLFVIAIALGLRQGEVMALQWSDVDLDRGTLSVRHTLRKQDRQFVLSAPKTRRSRRTITLPAALIVELQEHRQRQRLERVKIGPAWHVSDFVFTSEVGTPIDRRNLLRIHYETLERAGLPRMPFHDLRHTAASLMFALGLPPKVIQEMLGHSTIGITMDTYSKILPSVHERTSEVIEAIIRSSASKQAERGSK
jgi:integrase